MRVNKDEKRRILSGDLALLRQKLEEADTENTKYLKTSKDNARFYQGSASIIDELLNILKQ